MSVCPCSGREGLLKEVGVWLTQGPADPEPGGSGRNWNKTLALFGCVWGTANLTSYSSPWAVSKYFIQADARGGTLFLASHYISWDNL